MWNIEIYGMMKYAKYWNIRDIEICGILMAMHLKFSENCQMLAILKRWNISGKILSFPAKTNLLFTMGRKWLIKETNRWQPERTFLQTIKGWIEYLFFAVSLSLRRKWVCAWKDFVSRVDVWERFHWSQSSPFMTQTLSNGRAEVNTIWYQCCLRSCKNKL